MKEYIYGKNTVKEAMLANKNVGKLLVTKNNEEFINLAKKKKIKLLELLGIDKKNNKEIHLECIRQMLQSKSDTVIIQIQDLLLEGAKFRMNVPGRAAGCWEYRVNPKKLKKIPETINKIMMR